MLMYEIQKKTEMKVLIQSDIWYNVVEEALGKPLYLRKLNDILLAIGTLLPKSYQGDWGFIAWLTVGYLTFSWNLFLISLRGVLNLKFLTLTPKLELKQYLFFIILTKKLVNKGKTIFMNNSLSSFIPNWSDIRFFNLISLEMQNGETLIPEDVKIEINFNNPGISSDSENCKYKLWAFYLNSLLQENISKNYRELFRSYTSLLEFYILVY